MESERKRQGSMLLIGLRDTAGVSIAGRLDARARAAVSENAALHCASGPPREQPTVRIVYLDFSC